MLKIFHSEIGKVLKSKKVFGPKGFWIRDCEPVVPLRMYHILSEHSIISHRAAIDIPTWSTERT